MRRFLLFGIFSLQVFLGFSQENKDSNKTDMKMEKSNMLGLRTTIYKVGDLAKAKQWYTEAFGVEPYFDETFYVGFNIGGFELGLQADKEESTNKTENVLVYWGVENIHVTYEKLIQLGANENEKPYGVGGEIMTATVKDPFGNIIGIIYNPEFKLKK